MQSQMKIKINKQLILFSFLCLFQNILPANSVAGLYSMPQNSVKFEKQPDYSIFPIGWSKKGNAAFWIHSKKEEIVQLIIIDTVDDSDLWISDEFNTAQQKLSEHWHSQIRLFSERLAEHNIIPDEVPLYGSTRFSLIDDEYEIFPEETNLTGNRGISTVHLKIQSRKRGEKTLFRYIHNTDTDMLLSEFMVLGYFRSPWEERVAVISVLEFYTDKGIEDIDLKISGAHLTIGYRRAVSEETKLQDAVLSGQFYNCRTLLIKGADPDSVISTGEALLIVAARQNNWDLVFLLIQFEASIAVIDSNRRTLLHYAALYGDEEIAGKLILLGLNRNFKDVNGETASVLAERNGHEHLLHMLSD